MTDQPAVVPATNLDELETLPTWRRPRRLRRQLIRTLAFVVVMSVVLVGGVNFYAANELLTTGTEDQLESVGEARARSIEQRVAGLLAVTSATAADLSVVAALAAFDEAILELDDESNMPSERELDEIADFYEREILAPITAVGIDVSVDDLRPRSVAGSYLHREYVARPDAGDVVDAGDGSTYSEVHASAHGFLSDIAATMGATDLMLVSDQGVVVYTVAKRADLGTDLDAGPLSDTSLARTVQSNLPRLRTGDTIIGDFERYLPARGESVAVVAVAVRQGTEVIGSLVIELPVAALSAIASADGNWDSVGLGDGDSYVVGADTLIRTDPRAWLDDPDRFVDDIDDDVGSFVEAFDSPVGIVSVDTEPVRTAVDGRTFAAASTNYLGDAVFAYASPIDLPGVSWIIVTEVPESAARSPLFEYAAQLGVVLIGLVAAAVVIGWFLARRLSRPIPPLLAAAVAVVEGDRDPDLPRLGSDEFGDLARRLRTLTASLGHHEAALGRVTMARRAAMDAHVPPELGDDGDAPAREMALEQATVIALIVDEIEPASGETLEPERTAEVIARSTAAVAPVAAEAGLISVRVGADRALLVAPDGLEPERRSGVFEALESALRVVADSDDVRISIRRGVADGAVTISAVAADRLATVAVGEAVEAALRSASAPVHDAVVVADER